MHKCMMLHNYRTKPCLVPDGNGGLREDFRMRPSTVSPDRHWTQMVLGRFGGAFPYIQICGSEHDKGGPEIWISRQLKDMDEEGFVWLMNLIRSENIATTFFEDECERCSGHPSCVASIPRGMESEEQPSGPQQA
jgi:hypothetical protein